jgi:copper chaperone NosL
MFTCTSPQPVPVKLNAENCDYCKMTIADARFVSELITPKGRIYKFDDISCMRHYIRENPKMESSDIYVVDFNHPEGFLPAEKATFVKGDRVNSPMSGNTVAFSEQKEAAAYAGSISAQILSWNDLQEF